jgi:hypothetical protein
VTAVAERLHILPTPLPRQVRKAILDKKNAANPPEGPGQAWDAFPEIGPNGVYNILIQAPEPVVDLSEANIITSLLPWHIDGEQAHAPVLDIDFEHEYTGAGQYGTIQHDLLGNGTPPWWSKPRLALNDLMNSHFVVGDDEIEIFAPHLYLPSSTPGHAHLYLDIAIKQSQFFKMLDLLAQMYLIEHGYHLASKHRGYSAVRCPWVRKPQKDIDKKTNYKQILSEYDKAEAIEKHFLKVLNQAGYVNAHSAAQQLGMSVMYDKLNSAIIGLKNKEHHKFAPDQVGPSDFLLHLETLKEQAPYKKGAKKSLEPNPIFNFEGPGVKIVNSTFVSEGQAYLFGDSLIMNENSIVKAHSDGKHNDVLGEYLLEKTYAPSNTTNQAKIKTAEDYAPGPDLSPSPKFLITGPFPASLVTAAPLKPDVVVLPVDKIKSIFGFVGQSETDPVKVILPSWFFDVWQNGKIKTTYRMVPRPEKFYAPTPLSGNGASPTGIYLDIETGFIIFHEHPGNVHAWYQTPIGRIVQGTLWRWNPKTGHFDKTDHTVDQLCTVEHKTKAMPIAHWKKYHSNEPLET